MVLQQEILVRMRQKYVEKNPMTMDEISFGKIR